MSNINSIRLSHTLELDSVTNGDGLRMVLWFQGCLYACPGCHNPETWAIDGGEVYEISEILNMIENNKHLDGITLSGGDPMFQVHALKIMLPKIKEYGLNVWMYTAEVYEKIITDPDFVDIAPYIDVLVDGRFILSKLNLNIPYRGSTNQRLVDVQKSLQNNELVLHTDH